MKVACSVPRGRGQSGGREVLVLGVPKTRPGLVRQPGGQRASQVRGELAYQLSVGQGVSCGIKWLGRLEISLKPTTREVTLARLTEAPLDPQDSEWPGGALFVPNQ